MRRLRSMGITVAIDDFGTGYSCFGYLPKLKAMVQSLVTLAHNLNMQVIVEGVETPEQLQMIKKLGGNQVQGFLLGRPVADPMARFASNEAAQSGGNVGKESRAATTGK